MSFSPTENQSIGDKDTVAGLTRSVLILVQVNTARIVYSIHISMCFSLSISKPCESSRLCSYKVSFQFVMSLVLHHVDKTLREGKRDVGDGSEGFNKLCQKRGEVVCQIPPSLPFTGFGMSTTTTTHQLNSLALSSFLLSGFLFYLFNRISLLFLFFYPLLLLFTFSSSFIRPQNEF